MKKQLITITIIAITGIASCKKDNNNNNSSTNGSYTLASAFASEAVTSKTVTIDAATGGSFTGNSGSRYVFPANAFVNSTGAVVTGSIQIEVKEYLKQSDMLFSGVMPVTATGPLISGGETYVSATQGGQELAIASGKTYQVNMPQGGTAVTGMQLFTGQQSQVSNAILWTPVDSTSEGTITYNGDTTTIISNTVHFCNADKFLSSPDWQTFTVTINASGASLTDSIVVFALYDDYNGVWPMLSRAGNVISEDHVPNIPVHFAAVAIINGNFYGGLLGATPATGSNYNITVTKTTPSAFKTQIDAL